MKVLYTMVEWVDCYVIDKLKLDTQIDWPKPKHNLLN